MRQDLELADAQLPPRQPTGNLDSLGISLTVAPAKAAQSGEDGQRADRSKKSEGSK
jgi:hypothetical protein